MADPDLPDLPPLAGEAAPQQLPDLPPPGAPKEAGPRKVLENAPDEGLISGTVKNLLSGGIEGLSAATAPLGFVTQLPQLAADYALHYIQGKPIADVIKERHAREEQERIDQAKWFQETYGRPMPHVHTPVYANTGEGIRQAIEAQTGSYEPTSSIGRIGRAGVAGATSMIGTPGSGGVKGALTGLGYGAIPAATTEITGDPEAAIPTMLALPFAAHATRAIPGVKRIFPTQEAQQKVKDTGVDVKSMLQEIDNPQNVPSVPGTPQTTGELIQSPELLRAQTVEAVGKQPTAKTFQDILAQNYQKQNQAVAEHIAGAAPTEANKTAAPELFRRMYQVLGDKVDELNADIPNINIAEQGTGARAAAVEARDRAIKQRQDLYNLIDPEGRLLSPPVETSKTATAALHDYATKPKTSIMHPSVEETFRMAEAFPDVLPFNALMEFDSHINEVQSTLRKEGNFKNARRLDSLKTSVQNDIDNAVNVQMQWEKEAVARGELSPEQTFDAAVKRQREAWFPEEAARNTGKASATAGPASAAPVSGAPRAGGEARPADEAGARRTQEGIAGEPQGTAPLADDEYATGAPERWAAAKEKHAEVARTFNQGPVGAQLKTTGYSDQFRTSGTQAAESVFGPGAKGGENTAAWMRVIGDNPEGIEKVQNIATGQLRSYMRNGQLTPRGLEAWKTDFAPALAELEKKVPGFADRFNNTALATQALNDSKGGLAGKLLNVHHDVEMEDLIGKTLSDKNGVEQLQGVLPHLPAEHKEGLRRAASDWMLRRFVNTGGELKREQLGNFIRNNAPRLEALYGENYPQIQQAGEWLAKAQENRAAQAMPTAGSQTKFLDALDPNKATIGRIGETLLAVEALEHVSHGAGIPLIGAFKSLQWLSNWRSHSTDLLFKKALLDPASMKALFEPTKINGELNVRAFNALANEVNKENAPEREGRATGGAVTIDHKAEAEKLIKAVDAVRKGQARATEPLLAIDDSTITKSLAEAGKDI